MATLKASSTVGSGEDEACPKLGGIGFTQCAVTDVTVEVARIS